MWPFHPSPPSSATTGGGFHLERSFASVREFFDSLPISKNQQILMDTPSGCRSLFATLESILALAAFSVVSVASRNSYLAGWLAGGCYTGSGELLPNNLPIRPLTLLAFRGNIAQMVLDVMKPR
ncbi:hypothetical protein QLX08_007240 [Tetragonisca angustula]|uniref:Uncharacterized protein n=1 Tax=Tetragonisca angustula TaxID=166442 RepID=A0AAW0ZQ68_9HYME